MRLLGLDPGLRTTGWGVIDVSGTLLKHVANGLIAPDPELPLAERLRRLYEGLSEVIAAYSPDVAAVEETFVSGNAATTLKLGQARGIVLLAPALAGIPVHEYAARLVKKAVVGTGRAEKGQIAGMVARLLPGRPVAGADAADALAVAICHAHHARTAARWVAAGAAEPAP